VCNCTLLLNSVVDRGGQPTPRPDRFAPGKKSRYPLYRKLGRPQSQSGQVGRISPPPGLEPRNFQLVGNRYACPHIYVTVQRKFLAEAFSKHIVQNMKLLIGITVCQGTFIGYLWQKLSRKLTPRYLKDVPLSEKVVVQHVVPPCFGREGTEEYLHDSCQHRRLGCGCLLVWSVLLPIFNPLDFFLWDGMGSGMYHNSNQETRLQLVEAQSTLLLTNKWNGMYSMKIFSFWQYTCNYEIVIFKIW